MRSMRLTRCKSLLGRLVDEFRSFPAMRSLGLPIPTRSYSNHHRSLSLPLIDPAGWTRFFCPECAFVLLPHGHPFPTFHFAAARIHGLTQLLRW